jgi:prepilin-type N-terminal cleavage/methylation domain-containing protein
MFCRIPVNHGPWRRRRGFSLAEMLATLVIGAMILAAILGVYSRANRAADAVLRKISSPALASEVLQLIAEDIDRALGADDVTVQIRNGTDRGFARAELVLRRTFSDKENTEQVLEEITWRAGYDVQGDRSGLILYRSREGLGLEDKLLEGQRAAWERNYPFVPICRGVTFFEVLAYRGDELIDQWPQSASPAGVRVTISFAEPLDTGRGTREIADEDKISRTFVIDALREIRFAMEAFGDSSEGGPAGPSAGQQPGERTRETPGPATNIRPSQGSTTNERTPVQPRTR